MEDKPKSRRYHSVARETLLIEALKSWQVLDAKPTINPGERDSLKTRYRHSRVWLIMNHGHSLDANVIIKNIKLYWPPPEPLVPKKDKREDLRTVVDEIRDMVSQILNHLTKP